MISFCLCYCHHLNADVELRPLMRRERSKFDGDDACFGLMLLWHVAVMVGDFHGWKVRNMGKDPLRLSPVLYCTNKYY
jgi:hypothetical protein